MSATSDINSVMRRTINAVRILTEKEESELVRRWFDEKDFNARNELVHAHGKLVASMATKFQNSGAEFADLVHEGCLALIAAAERFDPSRKNRFSTYAAWWILSALQDAVHRDIYTVKIGRSRPEKKALRLLGTARQYLGAQLDGEAFERIAELSGCPVDVVRRVDGAISSRAISLNASVGMDGEGSEMGDFIEDENARDASAEAQLQRQHQRRLLEEALSHLKDARGAKILRERFLDDEERPLKEIAADLSISSERVRQIERDALLELKAVLKKNGHSIDALFG
jgi:RNA polymerase sigma factor (sigma-70 family)